jgi:hypothetical protein
MENIQINLHEFADFINISAEKQRFYIAGHGKSGTTWFSGLLAAHPQTYVLGERKLFEKVGDYEPLLNSFLQHDTFLKWFRYSSFGIVFPEQDTVRYELARMTSDYLFYRHMSQAHLKGWTPPVLETLRKVTWLGEKVALANLEDARNIVENLRHIAPGCKLLHIVRDGRDTAISLLFHLYRESLSMPEARVSPPRPSFLARLRKRDATQTARQRYYQNCAAIVNNKPHDSEFFYHFASKWQKITDYLHTHGASAWGADYLLVKYEDLFSSPHQTLSRVFDFLEIQANSEALHKIVEKMSFEAITGRKPGVEDIHNFYRKGVVGDWANYLNQDDKTAFKQGGGAALIKYGYELDDAW